jgi:tetratricopeptide (TPR) repeat protein
MSKAIFVSYASQDAEAARRICDILRTEGVEIWFDADGGLEHGDEWDAKIRRQIKECVLFMPIISATTQARLEGYFRIEWELAAQRALGIAAGVPFILPVVIDDTREPDALVPERFRTVQWTRMPGGVMSPEITARYLKLWSHRTGVLKAREEAPATASAPERAMAGPTSRRAFPTKAIALTVGVILAAIATFVALRKPPSPAGTPGATAGAGTTSVEADPLVRRARELVYDPDSARNEFGLAASLLQRAKELAPLSGPAWGASALLNQYFYTRGYDFSRDRLVRSQSEAEKALTLDPNSVDALLALGLQRNSMGEGERARDFLERAAAIEPGNPRVILAQSNLIKEYAARVEHLTRNLPRVAAPAELHYYISLDRCFDHRIRDAITALEPAITTKPFWRVWVLRAYLEILDSADAEKVDAWLTRVPDLKRDEPRVAYVRFQAASLRGDGPGAVRALNSVASDYFADNFFDGPKAFLVAQAHELAREPERAREQWRLAAKRLREKLEENPSSLGTQAMIALALQGLGREDEARIQNERCTADTRLKGNRSASELIALTWIRLGEPARAIKVLLSIHPTSPGIISLTSATLKKDRRWNALQSLPEYDELARMLREDHLVPKKSD